MSLWPEAAAMCSAVSPSCRRGARRAIAHVGLCSRGLCLTINSRAASDADYPRISCASGNKAGLCASVVKKLACAPLSARRVPGPARWCAGRPGRAPRRRHRRRRPGARASPRGPPATTCATRTGPCAHSRQRQIIESWVMSKQP